MSYHGRELGAIYNVYPASDGQLILLGTLEPKFWNRFCRNVGREDLLAEGGAEQVDYGADRPYLAVELRGIIASANGDEWARRFLEWDLPGSRVLAIDQVMDTDHFKVRGIVEERGPTEYPVVTAPIRWHDHGGRAGSGLTLPPTTGAHNAEVVQDWLGDLSEPAAERKASA
jgi:crotonobetainyl-CoA:carnitine CoA-transferase CaiB-like acyl-CoA transferase